VTEIHQTAVVARGAELGSNVVVFPFAVIEDDVIIGDSTTIGSNALIAAGTRIGKHCKIHHGAVLGTVPQDLKFGNEKTTLEIGDNTTIREYCTLNRGTKNHLQTVVGGDCLLMAYVHVAHDCLIGNSVVLANAVNMAGHVTIADHVGIGGMTPIHQFVHIGQHCFIGGGYRVSKDVPPFILAAGEPLGYAGINSVGLRRRGFSNEVIDHLHKLYKILYRSNLNVSQALAQIKMEFQLTGEIKQVVDFIEASERGIIK